MSFFGWIMGPINKIKNLRHESLQLHQREMMKMASLKAGLDDGTITNHSLDAVTQCLQSMSRKPTEKRVKK